MANVTLANQQLHQFCTEEWSLETEDGTVVQLLDSDIDPFRHSN